MAPKRSFRCSNKVGIAENYETLQISEVLCPICRYILIEPVTLPCSHNFCSTCFQGTLENANLTCPLCRVRFGSWHRIAKKENKITNKKLWEVLQRRFPKQISNRVQGIDEVLEEQSLIHVVKDGEIRKEYEVQKKLATIELQKEREAEERASTLYIKQITENEKSEQIELLEKLKHDELVARKLAEEETLKLSSVTPKKTRPLDKFLQNMINHSKEQKVLDDGGKCKKQKNLMNFAIETGDSNDSIEHEYRYFKPIEHRNIPPPQSSTPIKIPAKYEKPSIIRTSPSGNCTLKPRSVSAFAKISEKPGSMIIPKKRKLSSETVVRSKKQCYESIEQEFHSMVESSTSSSKTTSTSPSPHKMTLRERKPNTSPTYLSFSAIELTFSKIKGHAVTADMKICKDWKREQEEQDLQLAKKLQEEFNKERYLTRRSISCRNNIRKSRQVTLTEILSTSKCK